MTRTLHQIDADLEAAHAARRAHQRTHYEGDDMATPHDARIKALSEERRAAYLADWSRENTMARRKAFNAAVLRVAPSGKFRDGHQLQQVERETGIRMSELKSHVQRHGL